jgi:hypothetical protein
MTPFNLVSPGGVGDNIILLPILREIYNQNKKYHNFTIYSQFPELLQHFLPEFEDIQSIQTGVKKHLTQYLTIIDVPNFFFPNVEEVELGEPLARCFDAWRNAYADWGLLIRRFPQSCHQIAQKSVSMGIHRVDLPRYLLNLECEDYSYPFVTWPDSMSRPYITIHDGYDTSMDLAQGFSTKNWPVENWTKFVQEFKNQFPGYEVIQLGTKKSRPIPGAFHKLLGKLTFPETLQELAHSSCHVDGESGLVHARRMLKKPSVVMFGPTPMEYYGYPENENIASSTCYPCFWIQPHWQHGCILNGGGEPPCMKAIEPGTVMARVAKILKPHKHFQSLSAENV